MTAPKTLSISDLTYLYFAKAAGLPFPVEGVPSSTGTGGPISDSSQVANQYETAANVGTQTAPGIGTTIATVTIATTGYYSIRCEYGYGATAESTTPDNFSLFVNAGSITNLLAIVSAANTLFPIVTVMKKLVAGDVVTIKSGAVAGSAGSIYKAMLLIDRMS